MTKIYNTAVIAKNQASVGDDFKIFKYRGFSSTEFKKNYKLYDFELVKRDLMNHFYIRKGEKLENPNFGTIIWDSLFEQFTPQLREEIAKDVERIINFDKRIKVESISIDSTEIGIRISASLIYIPENLKDNMVIEFDRRNSVIK